MLILFSAVVGTSSSFSALRSVSPVLTTKQYQEKCLGLRNHLRLYNLHLFQLKR